MRKRTRILLAVGIILTGVLAIVLMNLIKPKASRTRKPQVATLVEVMDVAYETMPAVIRTTGIVGASREITLMPEVTGKIVHLSDQLIPGGRFKKGDLIVRIDPRDYQMAMKSEESRVRQAQLDLSLEKSRQKAAQIEWKLLGDERPEEESALALRKPQLEAAQVNLEAAQSNLQKARLSLSRTSLRAPFDCVVVDEMVDIGQLVSPNATVARLIGTERFRINASVPVDRLGLLQIPDFNSEAASAVKIIQDLGGGQKVVRDGKLVGLKGTLDPQTRTAQLLIALDNPMDPPKGRSPILNGAYVDLEIYGREFENVSVIPRKAIVEGKKVWIVDSENRLTSRTVSVGWGMENSIAAVGGLKQGDRVMITKLALPVEGMPVTIKGKGDKGESAKNSGEVVDES